MIWLKVSQPLCQLIEGTRRQTPRFTVQLEVNEVACLFVRQRRHKRDSVVIINNAQQKWKGTLYPHKSLTSCPEFAHSYPINKVKRVQCRSRVLSSSIRDQGIRRVLQSLSNFTTITGTIYMFLQTAQSVDVTLGKSFCLNALNVNEVVEDSAVSVVLPLTYSDDRNSPRGTKATGQSGGVLVCLVLLWTTYVSNGIAGVFWIMMMTREMRWGQGRAVLIPWCKVVDESWCTFSQEASDLWFPGSPHIRHTNINLIDHYSTKNHQMLHMLI